MDLSLLETLKQKLATDKKLSDIVEYFFDHFGDDPAFMDVGKRTRNTILEQFIPMIGGQLCGGKVVVTDMLLVQVPNTQFIHGGCRINGRLGNVIYFEDIQVGLLALSPAKPNGQTLFGRFSARHMPPESVPSKN